MKTRYTRGSNQFKKRTNERVLGIRTKTWASINMLCLILLPVLYFGNQAAEAQTKILSPISSKGYVTYAKEMKMPALAPLTERQRNIRLIKDVFGKDADAAIKVFSCESGLRTAAMNTHNSDSYPDVGVSQLHVTDKMAYTVADAKNAFANILQAKRLFDRRGWQPWDSSKHCWGSEVK